MRAGTITTSVHLVLGGGRSAGHLLTLAFFAFVFEGDSAPLAHWQTHRQSILEQPRVVYLAPLVNAEPASLSS